LIESQPRRNDDKEPNDTNIQVTFCSDEV